MENGTEELDSLIADAVQQAGLSLENRAVLRTDRFIVSARQGLTRYFVNAWSACTGEPVRLTHHQSKGEV